MRREAHFVFLEEICYGMGVFGDRRDYGSVLVYLLEAVGGFYKAWLFRFDRDRDADQLWPFVPGDENAAALLLIGIVGLKITSPS